MSDTTLLNTALASASQSDSAINPWSSITALSEQLRGGAISSVELTRHYLGRIAAGDDSLHAFTQVDEDAALAQAHAADLARRAGYPCGPLHGVPIALKDLLDVAGQRGAIGSMAWTNRVAEQTATVVTRLRAAHAVLIGRTFMVEFAFGGWGTNPLAGTPRNPWDHAIHRVPGGSSSGSGVAVGAALVPAALGSDTGGSIRIPAALNGVTGMKPTYGLVSLHGAFPLSGSLDSVGPLARCADDCAIILATIAGTDPLDPSTHHQPAFDLRACTGHDLRGMRIGLLTPGQYPTETSAEVEAAQRVSADGLRSLGALVDEIVVPFDLDELMRRNGQLIAAEAFAVHRDIIDDMTLAIGPYVRERVQSGRTVSAADYLQLKASQREDRAAFAHWMHDIDALLLPAIPFVACPLEAVDESVTPLGAFSRWVNWLGLCGLSMPAGFSAQGLPIASQLVGKAFDDARILRIASAFQSTTDWHLRRPALSGFGL